MRFQTYLSISGPNTAGPSRAMHGATADIKRASPRSKPNDNMCSGRKGNMQPTPANYTIFTYERKGRKCW